MGNKTIVNTTLNLEGQKKKKKNTVDRKKLSSNHTNILPTWVDKTSVDDTIMGRPFNPNLLLII